MKISNRLLGATAVFIVIMFLGMSLQSSVAPNTHHINTISMSEKRSYGTYFIQNPSNTSDNLSNLFISWLMNIEHANPLNGGNISNFHMPIPSQIKELFPQFLKENPVAVKMINKITYQEKIRFRMENREAGIKFMNYLKEHPGMPVNTVYTSSSNHSKYVVSKVSPASYPSGFPTWPGEFTMVSMNYFSISWWYPGPWNAPWDGHWGILNYGEHDTINILFVGSAAQSWYNQEYNTIQTLASWGGIVGAITLSLTIVGAYFGISQLSNADVTAILAIITGAGLSISFIQTYMGNQLHAMYDSTYANPLNGEPKFLWIFYSINFIYPWITVVGTFASTFTWNGYTNTGTVSILPYIPVASNNPAWVIVASALSGETHDLSGKIGWNSWGTVS
ncbi:MAG: hypothetical protein M1460_02630 [Candidatus Thermoplasmatota archaeon]|jgi:hypothetical protein|nr:hypothetical protein [Candidatus Thermoplasmatota archaeon]